MIKEVKDYLEASRRLRQATRAFGPILIVEDEPSIATFLAHLIEGHGLKAKVVNNIDDAMTYIEEHHEDIRCAIIDLHLRGKEGEEVVNFIETKHSRVPYLVYTGDIQAARDIEDKYPRATVLRKGDSISLMVEALGFNDRTHSRAC